MWVQEEEIESILEVPFLHRTMLAGEWPEIALHGGSRRQGGGAEIFFVGFEADVARIMSVPLVSSKAWRFGRKPTMKVAVAAATGGQTQNWLRAFVPGGERSPLVVVGARNGG